MITVPAGFIASISKECEVHVNTLDLLKGFECDRVHCNDPIGPCAACPLRPRDEEAE